jgi:hypothetical protein
MGILFSLGLSQFLIFSIAVALGSQVSCGEPAEPRQSEGTLAELPSGQEWATESRTTAGEDSAH